MLHFFFYALHFRLLLGLILFRTFSFICHLGLSLQCLYVFFHLFVTHVTLLVFLCLGREFSQGWRCSRVIWCITGHSVLNPFWGFRHWSKVPKFVLRWLGRERIGLLITLIVCLFCFHDWSSFLLGLIRHYYPCDLLMK